MTGYEKGMVIHMFKTRLLSGIVLVIIALVTIITGGPVLWAVVFALALIAFRELSKAGGIHSEGKSWNALEVAGMFVTTAYYALVYRGGVEIREYYVYVIFMVLLALMTFMFVYVFSFPKFKANQIMAAVFSFVYAPVMLSFIYLTRSLELGNYIVWMIFISAWGCDTCAYCVGMLIGKHKLAPILSPKKSIEGAIGGVVGAAALGAIYGYFVVEKVMPDMNVALSFAVIGGVGAVISQVGDLAASGIKRDNEIKDYGKLIPGHGGIMDRFDSVIFTAPIIYFLALVLL